MMMFSTVPVIAEDMATPAYGNATATGAIEAVSTTEITAPFSGVLLPFDLTLGDTAEKDAVLFRLDTQRIYAPTDGTIGAVFAALGDDAQSVINRYGALAAIEPTNLFVINGNTTSAYDEPENKIIHIGEKLYFKSSSSSRITGEGYVIAVDGDSYQLEVTSSTGDLELKERVTLYRDSLYEKKSDVGRGTCAVCAPVSVQGSGRIIRVYKANGDSVKAGDLLFESVSADAAPDATAKVVAPIGGVISVLSSASGQQVYKGQHLITLSDPSNLQVTCDVDEIDLGALKIGDVLSIKYDIYPDVTYEGTVTSISSMGFVKQNAAYYTVKLSIANQSELRLGMSATVYLND